MAIGLRQDQVTITNGTSLSPPISVGDHVPVGIAMPAAWTAAGLTFEVTVDGSTWLELYDNAGNELTFTVDINRYVWLDPSVWRGINMFKIRSGTVAVPVNQAADRVLTVVSRF